MTGINPGFLLNTLARPGVTNTLTYFENVPAVKICGEDVFSMAIPAAVTNGVKQNPQYGIETFFEESLPMIFNPFGPGMIAGGILAAKGFKGITAGRDTLEVFQEAWKGNNEDPIKTVFKNVVGHYGDNKKTKLSDKEHETFVNDFSKRFKDFTKNPPNEKKAKRKQFENFAQELTDKTGASKSLTVKIGDKEVNTNTKRLLKDLESVTKLIEKQGVDSIGKVKKLAVPKTLIGLGLSTSGMIGLTFFNKALTKWRTGSSEYCAYQDFGKVGAQKIEKTEEEKAEEKKSLAKRKVLLGVGMLGLIGATMGTLNPKKLMKKIELKDGMAGYDLLKPMYGLFLIGRMSSSRNRDELNNRTVRDPYGYLNWLVVGPIVAKGLAHLASKGITKKYGKDISLININGPIKDKNVFKTAKNWFTNISSKSHGEVTSMLKKATHLDDAAKTKIRGLHNATVVGGTVYTLLSLGIGINMITNAMTNKARAKELAALELKKKNGNHHEKAPHNLYGTFSANNNNKLASLNALSPAIKTQMFDNFTKKMQNHDKNKVAVAN